MSTPYFLLINPPLVNESRAQVVDPNSQNVYILPRTNISYYMTKGLFEKELINWCKQFGNPNSLFLDIGAHTGTYSISLAEHFKETYAFEPQRATFYALCGSVALSGRTTIECQRVGLGDSSQVGEQTLNIVSNDGGGSTLHGNGLTVLRKETISIRTLDSFQLDSVGFIKMDVEGNELSVLKGATETLKRSGYPRILFESNTHNTELWAFLEQLGYTIHTIANVSNMFLASK
jgi:FkbM family methyltransferase